jgi:hypothetical protein
MDPVVFAVIVLSIAGFGVAAGGWLLSKLGL